MLASVHTFRTALASDTLLHCCCCNCCNHACTAGSSACSTTLCCTKLTQATLACTAGLHQYQHERKPLHNVPGQQHVRARKCNVRAPAVQLLLLLLHPVPPGLAAATAQLL